MKSKLIVKDFGPIKSATLNLRNVNVLIGPQASGKSTLAKLYTICKSPILYHNLKNNKFPNFLVLAKESLELENFEISLNKFKESLEFYSISNFLNSKSIIEFDCPTHSISIVNNKITFKDKFEINKLIQAYEEGDTSATISFFNELRKKSDNFNFRFAFELFYPKNADLIGRDKNWTNKFFDFEKTIDKIKHLEDYEIKRLLSVVKNLKSEIFNNNAFYIPSERSIVGLLKQAALNFSNSQIPIPKHLLDYAAKYNTATFEVKELDLSFIKEGTIYKNVKGEDYIYFSKRNKVRLTESASGIQSIVPILLPIQNERKHDNVYDSQYSFVIEEPETNLFPRAQYDLMKFLEKDRDDDFEKIDKGIIHTYTTHSPFILSSLNNMLYAYKRGFNNDTEVKKKIDKILSEKNWINPDHFSAYQIINGKAKSIMNRTTGLIKENVIDSVSEDIIDDFRKIGIASLKN